MSSHVVMHGAPDGRSFATMDACGRVLVFRDSANAKSFARGLVQTGLTDVILANLRDLDLLGAVASSGEDDIAVFEDGVAGLSSEQTRERAYRLALDLGPPLLRRY